MKENIVTAQVFTPKSLMLPEDFLFAVSSYCKAFPKFLPKKWGWYIDEKTPFKFDLNSLNQMIPENALTGDKLFQKYYQNARSLKDGRCWWIDWNDTDKEIRGEFSTGWLGQNEKFDTHAHVDLFSPANAVDSETYAKGLIQLSNATNADFAYIEVMCSRYREFAQQSESSYGEYAAIATHLLRQWLPDVFWANVYGSPYIKLFGKEKLLSAPVAVAKEIGENQIYLQLTDDLHDVHKSDDALMGLRAKVKAHLEVDAFYDLFRTEEYLKQFHILIRRQAGTIHKVPLFELIPDEFTQKPRTGGLRLAK